MEVRTRTICVEGVGSDGLRDALHVGGHVRSALRGRVSHRANAVVARDGSVAVRAYLMRGTRGRTRGRLSYAVRRVRFYAPGLRDSLSAKSEQSAQTHASCRSFRVSAPAPRPCVWVVAESVVSLSPHRRLPLTPSHRCARHERSQHRAGRRGGVAGGTVANTGFINHCDHQLGHHSRRRLPRRCN